MEKTIEGYSQVVNKTIGFVALYPSDILSRSHKRGEVSCVEHGADSHDWKAAIDMRALATCVLVVLVITTAG